MSVWQIRFGLLIMWFLMSVQTFSSQRPGTDIRVQLASIDYRHPKNLDDYLGKCQQIRSLLPELDAFYRQEFATIKRFKEKNKNNVEVAKVADFFAALNAKDRDGFVLIQEEMALASQMAALPSPKRLGFFQQQIRPLQKKEDQLIEQEVQMAIEAKKKGMPLPDDVLKAIENKK